MRQIQKSVFNICLQFSFKPIKAVTPGLLYVNQWASREASHLFQGAARPTSTLCMAACGTLRAAVRRVTLNLHLGKSLAEPWQRKLAYGTGSLFTTPPPIGAAVGLIRAADSLCLGEN